MNTERPCATADDDAVAAPRAQLWRTFEGGVILVAFVATMLINLGQLELFDPDEARYTEVAREMMETGEYLIPQFNYEPRINKPAPYHWILAASLKFFGVTPFAARLPSVVAAAGTLLAGIYFARRFLTSRAQTIAAICVMASCLQFWWMARVAMVDMWLCLCITWTLVLLFAWEQNRRKWYFLWLSSLLTASGVNLKGPVALALPVVIFLSYLWVRGELRAVKAAARWGWILAATVVLSLPWYLWLIWKMGGQAANYFLLDELIQRFLGSGLKRSHGILFYVPVAFVSFLPWSLVLLGAVRAVWVHVRQRGRKAWASECPARAFLTCWILGGLLFLSIGSAKMVHYLLPLLPGGALLIADFWGTCRDSFVPGNAKRLFIPVLSLITLTIVAVATNLSLVPTAIFVFVALTTLVLFLHFKWATMGGSQLALVALLTCLIYFPAVNSLEEASSPWKNQKSFARILETWLQPDTMLYALEKPDPSLALRIQRPMQMIDVWEALKVLRSSTPCVLITKQTKIDDLERGLQETTDKYGRDSDPEGPLIIPVAKKAIVVNNAYRARYLGTPRVEIPRSAPVRLAALGDTGSALLRQYQLGAVLSALSKDLDGVIMLGDNVYLDPKNRKEAVHALQAAFELPYRETLLSEVPFYAILGNHDLGLLQQAELEYAPFHMAGRRYYTEKFGGDLLEVFFLDSNSLESQYGDSTQEEWLKRALSESAARWKVLALHHNLWKVSSDHNGGRALRKRLEPVIREFGIQLILCGHSHVYARSSTPGGWIQFVIGSGGKRPARRLEDSPSVCFADNHNNVLAIFDFDLEKVSFHALASTGEVIDQGTVVRLQSEAELRNLLTGRSRDIVLVKNG